MRPRKPKQERRPKQRNETDRQELKKRLETAGTAQKGKKVNPQMLERAIGRHNALKLLETNTPEEIQTTMTAFKGNEQILNNLIHTRGPKAPLRLYKVLGPERFKEIIDHLAGITPSHFDLLMVDAAKGRTAKKLIEEIKARFSYRTRMP